MSYVEYVECDDCGKQTTAAPFTLERLASGTLADPEDTVMHACSSMCLLRLAKDLQLAEATFKPEMIRADPSILTKPGIRHS